MNKNIWIIIAVAILVMLGAYGLISRKISKTLSSFHEMEAQFQSEREHNSNINLDNVPAALYEKALVLDLKSDTLIGQIEETKDFLIESGQTAENDGLNKPEINAKIVGLKHNIIEHREWIESNYPGYIDDLNQKLFTSGSKLNGKETPWEEMYFHHVPLAGSITILTKTQADIRSVEAQILDSLMVEMDKEVLSQ
jgi:hypothetical protein